MKKFEELASDIETSIRTGVLRAGDRLPSVRHTGQSRGVSASTVFRAYYLLEARGLIRARDRSGYYVTGTGKRAPPPEATIMSRPAEGAVAIDVSDLVFDILESGRSRTVVHFGSAFPSPLLFPMRRLGQSLASVARHLDPWNAVDELTAGSAALRRQIALRYLADGMQVSTDEIVITNGALEALNLCLMAVARPGDSVVIESPTFYGALQALERMGMKAIEVPTHPREGVDLGALEQAIVRHKPKACWLMTTFQNPLGSSMPAERKRALVDLLTAHDVPLIEDDVYAELYFGATRPAPAKAYDPAGIVMHCSSFSKNLAPGFRIGWVAAGRYASAVGRLKATTTLGAGAPPQLALADYLEKGAFDKHLRKLRHTLAAQQAMFVEAIGHYFPAGTHATRPDGGYLLWVELPLDVDALEVHRRALQLGISVAPGPIFSATRSFGHCLRLNYGHAWNDKTERALRSLGTLIDEVRAQ